VGLASVEVEGFGGLTLTLMVVEGCSVALMLPFPLHLVESAAVLLALGVLHGSSELVLQLAALWSEQPF
jgi:hypothetical protein